MFNIKTIKTQRFKGKCMQLYGNIVKITYANSEIKYVTHKCKNTQLNIKYNALEIIHEYYAS